MTDKPENPPAFPHWCEASDMRDAMQRFDGMTLRDYFAAAALQQGHVLAVEEGTLIDKRAEVIARQAYVFADEMLKARQA